MKAMFDKIKSRRRRGKARCWWCGKWKDETIEGFREPRFVGGWCWSCRTRQIAFCAELIGSVLVVKMDEGRDKDLERVSIEQAAETEIGFLPQEERYKRILYRALDVAQRG